MIDSRPEVVAEALPGIRLLLAPGHTDGHQVVVVETGEGAVVLGGDVGTSFLELNSGTTEGTASRARTRSAYMALTCCGAEDRERHPQALPLMLQSGGVQAAAVVTTSANSSWRLMPVMRAISAAGTTSPSGPRSSNVWVASRTNHTSYPRSQPMRAVVSQQKFV